MLQNLHTHSLFCDGADEPEEIIIRAIETGFDSVGFSSHAKTLVAEDFEIKDIAAYRDRINFLKEKYKGSLSVYLGTELDYFSVGVMDFDGFDYTIGSVHYDRLPDGTFIPFDGGLSDTVKYIREYYGGDGMKFAKSYYSYLAELALRFDFDIVGHFDLVTKNTEKCSSLFDTESREYRDAALSALHALREKRDLFEVNTGALSRGYKTKPYPAKFILEEMRRLGCRLVLTSDCHDKRYLDCGFDEAKEIIKSSGFDTLYYLTDGGFVGEKI